MIILKKKERKSLPLTLLKYYPISEIGTSQGSPLSPVLILININRIYRRLLHKDLEMKQKFNGGVLVIQFERK